MKSSLNPGCFSQKSQKRARLVVAALFLFSVLGVAGFNGCSLMKDRPIQLMSDTAAALKAAKEVSADTLAPDLYRRANDAYFRAQNEYRLKNFAIAEDYAARAKTLAEQAEFQALKQGSSRASLLPPDEPVAPPPPSDIAPPQGELATEAMKRESQTPVINAGVSGVTPSGTTPATSLPQQSGQPVGSPPPGGGASIPYPAAGGSTSFSP